MNDTVRYDFSIIVPIYKVQQYLDHCVRSVMQQSYDNFELILVDDGSPDECGRMCDQYATEYENIRVIHKANGGLSSARNAGLDAAVGNYVIFLDSDDFWDDSDALKNIKASLNETDADVLIFPAKRYYEDSDTCTYTITTEIDREKIIQADTNAAIRYMIEQNVYRAAAWNKVIRKQIIDQHQMRYKEGYLSEDMDWCGDLLLYADRFDYYSNPFYAYRQQRAGSITREKNEKLIADKLYMCSKGLKQAEQWPDSERGELLAAYYAYEYSVLIGVSAGVTDRKILAQIKELDRLLNYDISHKVRKVKLLRNLTGFWLCRLALCFFVKVKR